LNQVDEINHVAECVLNDLIHLMPRHANELLNNRTS
jgi:hypothetical protein